MVTLKFAISLPSPNSGLIVPMSNFSSALLPSTTTTTAPPKTTHAKAKTAPAKGKATKGRGGRGGSRGGRVKKARKAYEDEEDEDDYAFNDDDDYEVPARSTTKTTTVMPLSTPVPQPVIPPASTSGHLLVSPMSYPFIVITHENQWVEAASKLLLADCFSGCTEVSWPQFANTLHSHFLSAIKQDPANPTRALQLYELKYFHTKLLSTFHHPSFTNAF